MGFLGFVGAVGFVWFVWFAWFRRVRSVPSPAICVGALYLPLPRRVSGHVPGAPVVHRAPRVPGVPGAHRVATAHMAPSALMVSRVSSFPIARRVRRGGWVLIGIKCRRVPMVRSASSPTICGGFVDWPLPRVRPCTWGLGVFRGPMYSRVSRDPRAPWVS